MARAIRRINVVFLLLAGVLAVVAGSVLAATTTFSNTSAIPINDQATTTSSISVSGVAGTVTDVTVTITGLSHTWPDDIDVKLSGPNGNSVILFSDAGGSGVVNNLNLTFSDTGGVIPDTTALTSGTYAPANYAEACSSSGTDLTATHTSFAAAFGGASGAGVNGTWTLTVSDDCGGDVGTISGGWSITISDAPIPVAATITSGSPPNGTVGVAYSHTVTATGDPVITFSVSAGSLPGGLSLDPNSGVISGTPTGTGTFNFDITATNGVGPDTDSYSVVIAPAPVAALITSGSPPNGTVGAAYSHTVTAAGDPVITFSVSAGSLPGGLSLDPNSGVISGTPTAAGTFAFDITATNGSGPDTDSYSVVIAPVGVTPPPTTGGTTTVVNLPAPPPAPPCADVNFEEPGVVRTHFTNDADKSGLSCRLLAANGSYMTWLGGPLTNAGNIGDATTLDLGVIAAVDVFSSTGQHGFVGDVVVCLKGEGQMIYLNANASPRVPQLWSAWTTDAFPGYTCTTLYAPGTVILVKNAP